MSRPTKRMRTTPKVEDIDPSGDLVIAVGTGCLERHFRVSKQRLSDFSPVFKTKIDRFFAQGQKWHTADDLLELPQDDLLELPQDDLLELPQDDLLELPQDDPFKLPQDNPLKRPQDDPLKLPQDDPFCMSQIFSVAHSCNYAGSFYQHEHFGSMIVACHKYECITPFRFHLNAILRGWEWGFSRYGGRDLDANGNPYCEPYHYLDEDTDGDTDGGTDERVPRLVWQRIEASEMLAGAFLLDNTPVFQRILHQMFKERDSRYLRAQYFGGWLAALLPDWYQDGLVHAYTKAMDGVRACLYKPFDDLLAGYIALESCAAKTQLVSICSSAIYKEGLLPHRCSNPPRNYLKWVWIPCITNMECEIMHCSRSCSCREMKPYQLVRDADIAALESLKKVCLKCFKEKKYEAVVGSCEHSRDD